MSADSTQQAADKVGVHLLTLKRWVIAVLIRPSVIIPMGQRKPLDARRCGTSAKDKSFVEARA